MIHDLDQTLRQLLIRKAGLNPLDIDIEFDMPSPEWSTAISRPTVNVYLYDMRENQELRSNDVYLTRNEQRTEGAQRRALTRVDLSYMISVWTQEIADEHQLLGQILTGLLGFAHLPDDVLVGSMRTQPLPLRAWIAQPERMPNPWDFWGHVEHRMKSGICYVITASFEPYPVQTLSLVRERELRIEPTSVRPSAIDSSRTT